MFIPYQAWNLALQCEDQPDRMKELYLLCSQLLSLGPSDDSAVSRQMMCMLMSAAACLQIARTTNTDTQRVNTREQNLQADLFNLQKLYQRLVSICDFDQSLCCLSY